MDSMMSVWGNMAHWTYGNTVHKYLTIFPLQLWLMIKYFAFMGGCLPVQPTSMISRRLTGNRRFPILEPCATWCGRTLTKFRAGRSHPEELAISSDRLAWSSSIEPTTSHSFAGPISWWWKATRRFSRRNWWQYGQLPTTATDAGMWQHFWRWTSTERSTTKYSRLQRSNQRTTRRGSPNIFYELTYLWLFILIWI